MYFEKKKKKKTQTHKNKGEKISDRLKWKGEKSKREKKNNGCFFKQESKLKIESLPIATDHKT